MTPVVRLAGRVAGRPGGGSAAVAGRGGRGRWTRAPSALPHFSVHVGVVFSRCTHAAGERALSSASTNVFLYMCVHAVASQSLLWTPGS